MEEEQEPQEISVSDLVAIAKRRFWWIAVPVLLGPIVGFGLTYVLKHVYTSQAFVLIDQPKVGDKYVTEVVSDQTEAHLATMQDQILSRSQLVPIIHKYGLDRGNQLGKSTEAQVANLRKRIKVTPIVPAGSPVVSGFYVSADADQPDVAKEVCSDVLSMFIAQNMQVRQQRAEDTTQFLTEQLSESKKKLDQDDAALAAFKQRYMGQLPSDEGQNMQMLASTGTKLDMVSQDLAQAEQQKLFQESMIEQQVASQSKSAQQAAALAAGAPQAAAAADELETQLVRLQAQERDLLARYTPDHPDVLKVEAEIADLDVRIKEKKRLAALAPKAAPAGAAAANSQAANPELERMRLTLNMTEASIREKQAERERLQRELQNFEGRIQLSPAVEEKYKLLTRDYETSLQFYKDLLNKKTQSEMATDLERQQEGEQFRVMDQPSLPVAPSFPRRLPFTAGGLGAGFALGCCLALLQEMRQRFVRTEADVERLLMLPVLAGVPELSHK